MKPGMLRVAAIVAALINVGMAAQAAPTISGTSGTYSTGQSIQLSGSGFGSKSPAAPYVWADFEGGGNPSPLGQTSSWSKVQNLTWSTEGFAGTHGMKAADG